MGGDTMAGRFGRVGLAVALAGFLVACGSSGAAPTTDSGGGGGGATSPPGPTASQASGGGGGSASDPCSLLTASQISSAIGLTFGAGDSGGDTHSCDWSHDENQLPTTQVIASNNEDTGLCDEGSSSALGITVTQLSGIGDKACFIVATGLVSNLTFYKGSGRGWSVTAAGKNVTPANVQGIEQQLAQDMVGNL
ncbi:MAG: hypothetical protein ACHQZR_01700 [Candidatus Limnocylindrales bacterium]